MNLYFWKKKPIELPPALADCSNHRLIFEKEGAVFEYFPKDLQEKFGIVYAPNLDFPKRADFLSISQKVAKYRDKGFLDHRQTWLGAYFRSVLEAPPMPPVRLRWIDDAIGWGVFAERDLLPMEYIGEYAGVVRRKKSEDKKNAYCFQYAIVSWEPTRYTIDARNQGGIVRFINHSKEPNLMSALATLQNLSHVVLFTHRSVRKGEQLSYNYGPDYWHYRSKPREF